ncbi:MAG: hypothetical protein OXB84_02760 [Halobacteriovoraceae bacterium]|nr:hypothetical protein [Halobacteriovoraceae bacterium]
MSYLLLLPLFSLSSIKSHAAQSCDRYFFKLSDITSNRPPSVDLNIEVDPTKLEKSTRKIVRAIQHGNIDTVTKHYNEDLKNATDEERRSFLHYVAFSNGMETIKEDLHTILRSWNAPTQRTDGQTIEGTSHDLLRDIRDYVKYSVERGKSITDYLFENNYDLHIKDSRGNYAIHYVTEKASVMAVSIKSVLNNGQLNNPSDRAILDEIFDLMIEMIIYLNNKTGHMDAVNSDLLTPVRIMKEWTFIEGVERLRKAGFNVDELLFPYRRY